MERGPSDLGFDSLLQLEQKRALRSGRTTGTSFAGGQGVENSGRSWGGDSKRDGGTAGHVAFHHSKLPISERLPHGLNIRRVKRYDSQRILFILHVGKSCSRISPVEGPVP